MAVTGDGDFPFRSAWLGRGRGRGRGRGANPRKVVNVAVTDANRDIWADWAFEAAVSGDVTGTLSATEGQDTATFAGVLVYSGTLAATEAQDSATFAGVLEYSGTLAATEAQDTAAFDGTVAAATVTGDLAATEAQDTAAFDGSVTGATQSLHGRRVRGKRIIFPDELPPVELPKIEPLPSLEAIKAKVTEAKQALEAVQIAQIEAKERKAKDKALTALSEQYEATQAALRQAEGNERAWIRRLQDEDDFFLLAA